MGIMKRIKAMGFAKFRVACRSSEGESKGKRIPCEQSTTGFCGNKEENCLYWQRLKNPSKMKRDESLSSEPKISVRSDGQLTFMDLE